LEELRWEG